MISPPKLSVVSRLNSKAHNRRTKTTSRNVQNFSILETPLTNFRQPCVTWWLQPRSTLSENMTRLTRKTRWDAGQVSWQTQSTQSCKKNKWKEKRRQKLNLSMKSTNCLTPCSSCFQSSSIRRIRMIELSSRRQNTQSTLAFRSLKIQRNCVTTRTISISLWTRFVTFRYQMTLILRITVCSQL